MDEKKVQNAQCNHAVADQKLASRSDAHTLEEPGTTTGLPWFPDQFLASLRNGFFPFLARGF